jgi:putative ABC transport system permease protein
VIGVDDATMIGAPTRMLEGSPADLVRRDAGIIDLAGSLEIGGVEVGEELTFNDKRAVIVGKSLATRNFQSLPVIHTRYSQAVSWVPTERATLSAILVKSPWRRRRDRGGANPRHDGPRGGNPRGVPVADHRYVLKYTGIAINIGTTIALGFIVGAAIAGQTFYSFAVDNLKQFAALKAMGAAEKHARGHDPRAGVRGRGARLRHRSRTASPRRPFGRAERPTPGLPRRPSCC